MPNMQVAFLFTKGARPLFQSTYNENNYMHYNERLTIAVWL